MKRKIKIAIFVHGLSGGVGQVLLNYFSHMPDDYDLDLITMYVESDKLVSEFKQHGFNIIKVPSKSKSIIKNFCAIHKLLNRKKYDIAYANMTLTNFFPLFIAKMCGVKVRISHSHLAGDATLYSKLLGFLTRKASTEQLACGHKAGQFLYGQDKFKVLRNAIDLKKYTFNSLTRYRIRRSLGIGDNTIVIGNVGRFSKQKNHLYLLKIFKAYHEKNPNSILMLVGDGELKNEILKEIKVLNLQKSVKMLGEVNNVNELLQAMDIFLLPSLFEGLSLAVVEAEAAGLPCILSNTVSKESRITSNVAFLPLCKDISLWEKTLEQNSKNPRMDETECFRKAGYDINNEAIKFDSYLKYLVESR